jgi:hypothetical protein
MISIDNCQSASKAVGRVGTFAVVNSCNVVSWNAMGLFEHYDYIATHVLGKMFSQHKEKGVLK